MFLIKLKRSALMIAVISMTLFVPTIQAAPPSGPVTIETLIDFSRFPFSGTFQVTEGDDILGCLSGTFIDFPRAAGIIEKVFTCSSGGGSFIFLFRPGPSPGPGAANGHWAAWKATGAFAGLRGQGDFSLVFVGPTSGTETLTGAIHFDP